METVNIKYSISSIYSYLHDYYKLSYITVQVYIKKKKIKTSYILFKKLSRKENNLHITQNK